MGNNDKPLVVFGTGIFSDRMSYHFEKDGGRRIVAYTVERRFMKSDRHRELPCVAFEELTNHFPPAEFDFFAAMGYAEQNAARKRVVTTAAALNYELANYVSPSSQADDVELPGNCALMENSIVGYACQVGMGVILGQNAALTHDVTVKPFCYFSASATIAGMVTIGERVFCGVGSVLIDRIEIAAGTLIGAGSVVTKSIKEPGIYAGNPARLLRPEIGNIGNG